MKMQVFKNFLIFTVMIATTHIAAANDLAPTADWSHSEGPTTTFLTGTYVVFDGSLSHDNDEGGSSITYYKWYVDGSPEKSCSTCSSFGWTFTLASGQSEKQVQVKLRVRDDEGNWATKTITYTIRRQPGRTYYLKDHLGNVRVTVDEDGNAIGWDDYYPFGKIMPGRSSNNANPNDLYKYTGHERDSEANLNLDYMGARYYDPEIGRWLGVDTFSDRFPHVSPYNYVENNPISFLDPNGLYRIFAGQVAHQGNVVTVSRIKVGAARMVNGLDALATFVPGGGFIKGAFQGLKNDPSFQSSNLETFSLFAGLGTSVLSRANKTGKIGDFINDAFTAKSLFDLGKSASNLLTPPEVGFDETLFGALGTLRSGSERIFNDGGETVAGTTLTLNKAIASSRSLEDAEEFTNNLVSTTSSILKAIANGNNLDFSSEADRKQTLNIFNESQETFQKIIFELTRQSGN